ncbi:MAG TPA: cytochrome c [Longimicrobiaceae bacterium]|nr:cytochrome c [Longimicrobiaceae bacterium]
MKRAARWTALVVGSLIGIILLALGLVYGLSEYHIRKSYDIQPTAIAFRSDAAAIGRGRHIATTRGCTDCHGKDMSGALFIDAMPVARLSGSNLTAGEGGVGDTYDAMDWIRAVRHGVGEDGKPLLFMPAHEFYPLSDQDMGALVAYLQSLSPVNKTVDENTVGPLGRVLYLAGKFPLLPAELIDHDAPRPEPVQPGATAEYGAYLATGCTGCHGEGFSGGKIPGTPPDFLPAANITPDAATGIGDWSEADFFRALREGRRPDGTELDGMYMPWRTLGQMTDTELRAIWLYLRTVPAKPAGNH